MMAARVSRRIVAATRPTIAGVGISHPDRIIYPDLGVTKLGLARYYEAVAEWMLPHVAGRPLTLVHCPRGLLGDCVYMRHTKVWGPGALRRITIQEKTKVGEYLVADDVAGIIALVQMGIVEIHTWNVTADHLEHPNRIVWDLDPGPAVSWPQVIAAARTLRAVLETLGLECWVKTTGGRGLHVVVPVIPRRDWSECLAFSRAVAEALARTEPARFTTTFAKAGRESTILIDYLRNNRTNTSIAAFSTRARPGGPVSMPIRWDELRPRVRPEAFTVNSGARRLSRLRADPWPGYATARQRVTAAALRAISGL